MKKPDSVTTRAKPGPKQIVNTHTAAAKVLKLTTRTLRNYRAEGAPGFHPDGRVDLALLRPWIEAKLQAREGSLDLKEEKTLEEVRKLRLANDQREGRLVERAWVAERIQRAAGEMNAFRAKWEAEFAVKFAAAAGDIPLCRTICREGADAWFTSVQTLSKHLQETA